MSVLADRAWARMEHLLVDEESDELLEGFLRGLLQPADRLSLVAYGDDARGPLEVLFVASKAEIWSLPIVALVHGGTIPARRAGETDEDYLARARIEIVRPRGMRRGFKQALRDVAQPFVTAPVRVIDFLDDNVWRAAVVVPTGSVADEDALEAAVNHNATVVAGMRIEIVESDDWLIADMEAAFTTIADLEAAFNDIDDLEAGP